MRDGSMTWKPKPDTAAPSAWIDTFASALARLAIRARSSMQGPTDVLSARVSTTVAPRARRMRRACTPTLQVYAASA